MQHSTAFTQSEKRMSAVMVSIQCCTRLATVLKRSQTDLIISNEDFKQQHQTGEVGSLDALALP